MTEPVYGPITDATDVDHGLVYHLKLWMPTYVPYVTRQKEAKQVEREEPALWPTAKPKASDLSYIVRHAANQTFPEDQLPALLAYCPGMRGVPHTAGDGNMRADWDVALTAIASGQDIVNTRELAFLFMSAAQMAIMQHKGLSGLATEVQHGSLSSKPFTIVGGEKERSLLAIMLPLVISVQTVLNAQEGPVKPLVEPEVEPEAGPTVKSEELEVSLG